MKGCHSCEHASGIADGRFEGLPWEAIPCSTCDVMSSVGFAIEFDETRGTGREGNGDGQDLRDEQDAGVEQCLPLSVMEALLIGFLRLPPELRDVVAWRYAGFKYSDIAATQGVTQACAEKRHRRAMELWPELRELFPRKVAKQGMRKPHRRRPETGDCGPETGGD